MKIKIHRESTFDITHRVEMLGSMFEMPIPEKLSINLEGEVDLSTKPWNIGLIVGPSGSGKTITLNELFGGSKELLWNSRSVIDDFPGELSMESISRVCQSVGFNTIPAWLRPFNVLSNGERFRCEVARRLLSNDNPIVIDEFTSVVDRQVAQFACHSIQKYVRETDKHLVAASCHYDIIDWLQPDWILEPGSNLKLSWRGLQRRPSITASVCRVRYETWELFKQYHYLSADLNRAARCYGLFVQSQNPPELGGTFDDADLSSQTDDDGGSSASSGGLRVSPGLRMQFGTRDSSVVSGYAESVSVSKQMGLTENSLSRSSSPRGSAGSGDRAVQTGPSERRDAGQPLHQLSPPEVSAVGGSTSSTENASSGEDGSAEMGREVQPESLCKSLRLQNSMGSSNRGLYGSRIASMCGVLYRPHPRVSDIYGFTRMVTLPDFQGLGLAFVLACKVAAAYKALGKRLHSYPNHPAWIRSYQRSPLWMQVKESGSYSPKRGVSSTVSGFGGRRCAVFLFIGDALEKEEAERLINVETE
jgi:ABC-type lipoprotein export system ATPase subunit